MKRFKKLAIGVTTGLAVLAVSAGAAAAANQDQVVSGITDHSLFKFGRTVTVTGTVNGDIFCAGQTVNIDAVVNGDVICAGQTVTVDGTVNGNVRVAGQTVNVGAKVNRSASLAAQDATIQGNATVVSDLSVAGQTVTIDGLIGRDVQSADNTLVINSQIGRDVQTRLNKLELGNAGRVGRNLDYTSTKQQNFNSTSIGGQVAYHKAREQQRHMNWGHAWLAWNLYIFVSLLALSLVLVAFFPQQFVRWNKLAAGRVWATLLTGFIAMFVVPALIVGLLFTLVGVPLAFFMAVAWLLAVMLSAPLASFYLGRLVWSSQKHAPLIVLAGGLVLGVLCLIPVLGFLVTVLAVWFGTGSVLLNLKAAYKKPVHSV